LPLRASRRRRTTTIASDVMSGLREVRSTTAQGKFGQTVSVGRHAFPADEPEAKGGNDAGPAPHELLLSSLASCIAMTIQGYADRKGLVLRRVEVTVNGRHEGGAFLIEKHVDVDGDLDARQLSRLLEIGEKCPVTRTMSNPIRIVTV
jgi:putative redox protein